MSSSDTPDEPRLLIVREPEADGHAGSEAAESEVAESEAAEEEGPQTETVEQPAKVMRIGSMIKQLLDEVRQAPLDEASRARLKEIYETSVRELANVLSPDLREELDRLAPPFEDQSPTDAELRVAHAQLVGWLEGLFHGIQATLFAQQMAARAQLEEMRQRALPASGQEQPTPRPPGYL